MQNISKKTNSPALILNRKRKGFTLIELIVVIAIIGILVLLAMPKFMDYTRDAKNAKTQHDARVAEDKVAEVIIGNDSELPENLTEIDPTVPFEDGRVTDPGGKTIVMEPGPYFDVSDEEEIKDLNIGSQVIANSKGDTYVILDEAIEYCTLRADQQLYVNDHIQIGGVYTNVNYPDAEFYDFNGFVGIFEGNDKGTKEVTIIDYRGLDDEIIVPGEITVRTPNVGATNSVTHEVIAVDMQGLEDSGVVSFVLPCTIGTAIGDGSGDDATFVCAEDYTGTDFTFDSGTGTITDYLGSATDIDIPCMINGVAVTAIGDEVFDSHGITNITIPESVTSIGMWAFSYNNLTTVTIPDSVITIGYGAFQDNQLTSVVIGNSVETIIEYAFYRNSLNNLTIPDSVVTIEYGAFMRNNLTSITLGNGVQTIGIAAFSYNQLTGVTIPDGVTTIGSNAFEENFLTSVTMPGSVATIGDWAFSYNGPLQNSGSLPATGDWTGTWTLLDGTTWTR